MELDSMALDNKKSQQTRQTNSSATSGPSTEITQNDGNVLVSIVIPIHNGEQWIDECLKSVYEQTFLGQMEVSVYDDSSTDNTQLILEKWRTKLTDKGLLVTISKPCDKDDCGPRGVGYAKNRAVYQSKGRYLCFLDVDDVMDKERIHAQYETAMQHCGKNVIIGCQFWREPPNSTERYTHWANTLTANQMYTQAYTSHGPTVIMPTWFCSRKTFDAVGGFDEYGKGSPEDLVFFYKHLDIGGKITRVDKPLLMYRYHVGATTFSIKEETIWKLRVRALEKDVLNKWETFTIWNAGKQGKQFYRELSEENRTKVAMFCDVDQKKISKGFYTYEDSHLRPKPRIAIVHFTDAKPPFVICVKQGLTRGEFEKNLESLCLVEGKDYYHFN